MELGNICFGHSRGEFPIPRQEGWEEPFFELLDKMSGDDDGYAVHFDNATFYMHPYCWCDKEDCPQCGTGEQYNFYMKGPDVGVRWYKYPLRDSYCNKDISLSDWERLITFAKQSLDADPEHDWYDTSKE